jgi:hypothetical protein
MSDHEGGSIVIKQLARFNYPQDLEKWKKLYPGKDPTRADEWLGEALATFQTFGEKYDRYFKEEAMGQLDPAETTEERLKARALQALDDYWTPLGRVAEQRQVGHYRTILDQGTEEARKYLDTLGIPGVLIYFDKVPTIRYCPYTNFAFVGTPYRLAAGAEGDGKGDWMAIPHELGHYVYWNLGYEEDDSGVHWTCGNLENSRRWQEKLKTGVGEALKSLYPDQEDSEEYTALKQVFLSWLEEIVADVVGAWLGEAQFTESFGTLLKRSAGNVDELQADDGCHPVPWLRAFLREYALKLKGKTPTVDWGAFFRDAFRIEASALTLEVPSLPVEKTLSKVRKKHLIEMLTLKTTETPEKYALSIPSYQLEFDQARLAIETLVKYLYEQIDRALGTGLPQLPDPGSAFDRLFDLARKEAGPSEKLYEILLRPRMLEGGLQHTHGCIVFIRGLRPPHGPLHRHAPWTHPL